MTYQHFLANAGPITSAIIGDLDAGKLDEVCLALMACKADYREMFQVWVLNNRSITIYDALRRLIDVEELKDKARAEGVAPSQGAQGLEGPRG